MDHDAVEIDDRRHGVYGTPTELIDNGNVGFTFGSGSDTEIGTVATASSYPAGIDLKGYNADVHGYFNDNGFVIDTTSSGATVEVDTGSTVKGTGFYEYSPISMLGGGTLLAGDCPGTLTLGSLTFGSGGVSNLLFQINDATGTAGPSPDASGHVNGWGLIDVNGDLTWAASADQTLTVNLQSLASSTTEGNDVTGATANFDPTQSYSWAVVHWTGAYIGPTDVTALNDSTVFNTGAFQNSFNGTFAWSLDLNSGTLYLTYTPAG